MKADPFYGIRIAAGREATYTRATMNKLPPPLSWTLAGLAVLLAACAPQATPASPADPNAFIRQSVAATLAALPTAAPYPTPIPYPTPTPFNLGGLFCEYNFCIGHPADVAFFDLSAQKNPTAPSSYMQGMLVAYNTSIVIQLIWQHAPGAADPQFLIELILEDGLDTRAANYDVRLVRDMNVVSSPITSAVSPILPFGGVAGWVCGDRAFAWKVYTPQEGMSENMLQEALARFHCE